MTRIRHFKKYKGFILFPDDPFKKFWDMFIMVLLLIAFVITPYKIAFIEKETIAWLIIETLIDLMFLIDIFLNFFMAYHNSRYLLIDSYKVSPPSSPY